MKNKNRMIKRNVGFTAIELLFTLVIISSISFFTINYINSFLKEIPVRTVAIQAYNYSNVVQRFIVAHQNLLQSLLASQGQSKVQIITLSSEVLKHEGFLGNNLYDKNSLNQIPCTVIYWDNNQLQSFIYYRENNDSKKLSINQLKAGLNTIGAMLGLYQDGVVTSAGLDWNLSKSTTNSLFIKQGNIDPSKGVDPSAYQCQGSTIANNSYVVNVSSMLVLNNKLPNDNSIHQYSDTLHAATDVMSNNRMNSDLNMDYTDGQGKRTKSNLIFQLNPNCVMDPNNPASMQDYDPGSIDQTRPNVKGCRNKQLAIQAVESDAGLTVTVTGFRRGRISDKKTYLGALKVASFQPTAKVQVGMACQPSELGKMAQQAVLDDPDDVNNLYISQVQCMLNPLCPVDTKGYCYMPINSVTINYQPYTASFSCPLGTFVDRDSIKVNRIDIRDKVTCHANILDCKASRSRGGNTVYSNDLNREFIKTQISRTITIAPTQWYQWCGAPEHDGCNEGWGNIADTQDTIASVNCTNDPSKASILIQE